MSNQDKFQAALNRKDFVGAARLAIEFGQGKSSKSGAWAWADDAVEAAKAAGIDMPTGNLSWPNWDLMEAALLPAE